MVAALAVAALASACRQPEAAPAGPETSAPASASSSPSAPGAPGSSPAVPAAPVAAGQVPAPIAAVLAEILRQGRRPARGLGRRRPVPALPRRHVASKRALEIGWANGYSAIWIGLGMRETGGKPGHDRIRSREREERRGERQACGPVRRREVIPGDAFTEIPRLNGTFDCVFVDAWKRDYIKFFDMTFPRMDTGGLFLGHNVMNKKSEMTISSIASHASGLFTSIVAPSGEGISVSYKNAVRNLR